MRLSVIIPTRNRANLLASALRSLQSQSLSPSEFEILIIDNGSTDSTRQIVEFFQSLSNNVRYFYEADPGLHVGRHRGLKEARSEVLVYTDDDIEATPGWLTAIADCFSDQKVAMVGGNNLPKFISSPPDWFLKLWQQPNLSGQAIAYLSLLKLPEGKRDISPFCVWGCNFSIRKQVLLDSGGFHPDGMPAELIRFRGDGESHVSRFVQDSGLRSVFDSKASVFHVVPSERMTMDYFQKRAFNQGVSDSYTSLRALGKKGGAKQARTVLSTAQLKRLFRAAVRRFMHLMTVDPDLRRLNKIVAQGYKEGFAFHQNAFRDDTELRAWVLKPDYFQE